MGRAAWMLVLGLALIALAVIGLAIVGAYSAGWMGMRGWDTFQRPTRFESNGERIYYTGVSASGDRIAFRGGPHWLYVHGGSCADCHGPGGRGGIGVPMTDQIAPDIRHSTLTSPEHDKRVEEEHPPYTDELIRRAITQGLDPAGKPLHWSMPRWQMSDGDLDDLVGYLKKLDEE